MATEISNYIQACETCQIHKRSYSAKIGYLNPIPVSKLFSRIHIDIVGPLPETIDKNKSIITCIDSLSRYAFAKAKQVITSKDIVEFLLQQVISIHGVPGQITSDNGTQFTSQAFYDFVTKLDIKHARTCDYNPAANGMDERFNATLAKIIKNYTEKSGRDWDKQLSWALLNYNTTIHDSTSLSPYSILFGRKPRSDIPAVTEPDIEPQHRGLRKHAAKATRHSQIELKSYYDLKCRPGIIKENDFIYVLNTID